MKVFVGQIYTKPGVDFPFTHLMQRWLGEELTRVASEDAKFQERYGSGFALGLRISADTGTAETEVKGPTVFKRDRDIEYTLVLPFDAIENAPDRRRMAVECIAAGIAAVFAELEIGLDRLDQGRESLVERLLTDPTFWSDSPGIQ